MQTPERDHRLRGDRGRRSEVVDDEFVTFRGRNRPIRREIRVAEKDVKFRPVDHHPGRLLGGPFQALHVDDHRRYQPGDITLADTKPRPESDGPGLDREPRILGQKFIDGSREGRGLDPCFQILKQRLLHQGMPPGAGIGRDPDVTGIEQSAEPSRRILEAIRVHLRDGKVMTLPFRKVGTGARRLEIRIRDPRRDLRRSGLDRGVTGGEAVRDQHSQQCPMRNHRVVGGIDLREHRRCGVEITLSKQRFRQLKLGDRIDLRRLRVRAMPERRQNRDQRDRDERELPGASANDGWVDRAFNRAFDRSRLGRWTFGLGGL